MAAHLFFCRIWWPHTSLKMTRFRKTTIIKLLRNPSNFFLTLKWNVYFICVCIMSSARLRLVMSQIKSNHFYCHSPRHKCLGEWNFYERAPDSEKKTTKNLHMDRQCKKTTNNLHMDRQCKKNCTGAFTVLQTVQKNNNNLHMDSTYLQTVQKTICKIHIHILSTHSVL